MGIVAEVPIDLEAGASDRVVKLDVTELCEAPLMNVVVEQHPNLKRGSSNTKDNISM